MDRKIFKSVNETVSIKNLVYDQLKNAILAHRLKPGERITEAGVARQMSVSHTPVREALRDLAKEGLIEIIPNKGSYVASLNSKDIIEIYTLRQALEQLAVKLSEDKLNDVKIKGLEEIAIKCREANRSNKLREYNEYDSLFHLSLIQLSENVRLEHFYSTLKGQIQLIMVASIKDPAHLNPNANTPDHFDIIKNLKKKNFAGVSATIEKHVNGAMMDALSNVGDGKI